MITAFTIDCDRAAFFDITGDVCAAVKNSGVKEGLCVVSVSAPTAAVVVTKNSDSLVRDDILDDLEMIFPARASYIDNADPVKTAACSKSAMTGPSLDLIIKGGEPMLGRHQSIYIANYYDRAECEVNVQCIGAH